MKKILLFVCFVSLFSWANAQQNALPPAVKNQLEALKHPNLNLNEVQLSRIAYVLEMEYQNALKIQKTFEGNKSVLDARLKEHKEHIINNIKGAITPTQAEIFDNLKLAEKF